MSSSSKCRYIYSPSISRIEPVTLKMVERALANGRSDTRELPLHTERSPDPNVSGVASDDIPRSIRFWAPIPAEIFLGRRYSEIAIAKSRSCQAFLQAYVANLFPLSCCPSIWCSLSAPFPSSSSTYGVLQVLCVRVCFIFIYRRVLIFIPFRQTRSANRREGKLNGA